MVYFYNNFELTACGTFPVLHVCKNALCWVKSFLPRISVIQVTTEYRNLADAADWSLCK
jgi:NADH:ubiquinone oxidoreductase subunit E